MKKIGLVLAQPPSYSETFFNSKIAGLQRHGFQVILFCQTNSRSFSGCTVKTFPNKKRNPLLLFFSFLSVYISLLPYFERIIRWYHLEKNNGILKFLSQVYLNAPLLKTDLDWLHYGFATMALERESLAKVIGAKMAVSLRGFDVNVYPKKHPNCYNKVWAYVDKVHSISNYLVQEAITLGLDSTISKQIITPAVYLEKFKIIKNNNQRLKLVTVARLTWIKGLDFLIETAGYLQQKNIDFEWLIVGDGRIKEKERYLFHTYEKKLLNNVSFLGKKTHHETIAIVNKADIYVQTSLNEGFCNAVLEAQALGKLCLAFQVGGLSENIIQDKTGWLVEPFETKKLAEKIVEVSQLSIERKQQITLAAIDRVHKEFNIEKQQQEFVDFYKN